MLRGKIIHDFATKKIKELSLNFTALNRFNTKYEMVLNVKGEVNMAGCWVAEEALNEIDGEHPISYSYSASISA
jgi:hypothetical protein